MAIIRKAEMLEVIKSYREQQEFLRLQHRKIKEIKTKYTMICGELNSNNSLELLAYKAECKSVLKEYEDISKQIESVHQNIRMNPFLKETYKDIYYEILMITSRGSNEHYNLEDYKKSIKKIEGIYNMLLEGKRNLFYSRRDSSHTDDVLVIVDGFKRDTIRYDEGDRFTVVKSYFEEKTISNFDKIVSFDSLFICYTTSNDSYSYGDGDDIIDSFIRECYPHLVL